MIATIKNAVTKHAWLFLAAAWLYTLSFIFTNYLSYSSSAEKVAKILGDYIQGQENSFKNILHDSSSVSAIINDAPSEVKEQLASDAQGIFAYQVNDIGNPIEIFWNTNKMAIQDEDLARKDGHYIVNYQNGTFEFIKTTLKRGNITYYFCTLIPVRWQYFMENEYLRPKFAVHEEIGNTYEITESGNGSPIRNSDDQIILRVHEKNESQTDSPGGFSIFLRVVAIIFLLIFINKISAETVRRINFVTGYSLLVLLFLAVRLIIYFLPFPFHYRALPFFETSGDSSVYRGGAINRSLGDLFVNTILLFWLVIFFRKYSKRVLLIKLNISPAVKQALISAVFLVIPLISFYVANIISSLVTDSRISFNAADFFSLNIFSFIGFLIICVLLYIWLYITGLLVQVSLGSGIGLFWRYILIISWCFLLISVHLFAVESQALLFLTGFILVLITFIEYRNNPSLSSFVSSPYFIFWALVLTAAASGLIISANSIKEKKDRIIMAEAIQQESDSSETLLLRMAITNFSDKFLQNNFSRFESAIENRFIKDSLVSANFSAFINKFITRIYVFNESNRALYNDDSATFDLLSSVLENNSNPTSVPGLYFYRNKPAGYNYIFQKKVEKDSNYAGSVFVLVQRRSYKNDALVPELFKQVNDVTRQLEKGYAVGRYNSRRLTSSLTGFNFADSVSPLQIPKTGYYYKDSLGYSQLWYNAGKNKLIIIAKKNKWLSNFVTLFAYLFVLFIMLAFAVHKSRGIWSRPNNGFRIGNLFRFNIRTQIQTTIIGVSIFSFLVIGAVTISFFIARFDKSTYDQLFKTAQILVNEIQQTMKSQLIPDDIFDISDFGAGSDFEKKILDIAMLHNTDINFYAKNGSLMVTSQSSIYNKAVLSNKIDPDAFYEMHYRHSTKFVHTEQIGNFEFQSIYMPVKDENDETIAYLNIPSLSSHSELQEEISDFLVTLIILNALIFIFAGAIAVTLTGRITSSLELIGNKMKDISIGHTNEEIEWKGKDEIGVLVDEYNKMVKKLEQSVNALAKSEREGAWREMARQVAHEIKNPLTPMKLSVQYLQRAIENNAPNTRELSQNVASTLVEQIDQLSKIAGDFSQFANIEYIKPERFDVSEVIHALVNLYNADSHLQIRWKHEQRSFDIMSDKTQINRLFTNLIKNALEASTEKKTAYISINQFAQNGHVVISLSDKGHGIERSLQSKIFDPNFTTKSSGTGLGLAICKAIVEKANGKIWFETEPGRGTTFFVELPLAQ